MQSTKIASLPEVVKLLRALSGDSQSVSVLELAEVIQSDPMIMAKVIGAANMFAYNPNGVEVTAVSQAIHVIGYERIRTLAMSLMLAEQVSRTHSPDAQREYAAQSLMAGCIAQTLAANRMTLDKEQAFICASLRNFGQIVLTSCMAEEFQQLRKECGGEPDDASYRRVFGLTPLELGHQLLDAANLPSEILATLKAIPVEAFSVLERKPEDQMLALTAFAGELATLTFDSKTDPADFAAKSGDLAHRYEHVLPHLNEEIHHLMESATTQLDSIVRTFRIKSLPPRMMTRMAKCRNAVDPNRPAATPPVVVTPTPSISIATPSGVTSSASPASTGSQAPLVNIKDEPIRTIDMTPPKEVPGLPAHDWDGSLNKLTDLLRQPGMSRGKMYAALLDIVRTGLGAQGCLMFSADAGSKAFPLIDGLGDIHTHLKARPNLEVVNGERTVLGVCLARNENIIIHHAHEARIQPYLPNWLKEQTSLRAFVLLPLSDGTKVAGVVVAGWAETRQIVLPPECVKSIRAMLALVCRISLRLAA